MLSPKNATDLFCASVRFWTDQIASFLSPFPRHASHNKRQERIALSRRGCELEREKHRRHHFVCVALLIHHFSVFFVRLGALASCLGSAASVLGLHKIDKERNKRTLLSTSLLQKSVEDCIAHKILPKSPRNNHYHNKKKVKRMRILSGVIAFMATSSLPSSDAFVPALRIPRSTQLAARPPPPVPPPPPEKPDAVFDNLLQKLTSSDATSNDSGGDLGDVLNGLLNDLSTRIQGGVTLPSLPDLKNKLPDLASMQGLQDLRQQFIDLDESVIAAVDRIANQLQDGVVTDYPQLAPYLDRLQALLAPVLQSPSLSLVVSALLTYTVVSSLLNWDRSPPPSQPYPAGKYDPIAARAYFDTKWHLVVSRGLEILVQSLQFGLTLLRDKLRYVECVYRLCVRATTKGHDEGFFFDP